jgi:hypothetical protein
MNPKVSFSQHDEARDKKESNETKIIKALAECTISKTEKMNKWDIAKKTRLDNPRVYESMKVLENSGFVEKVGEKKIKNRLRSLTYNLTFKGALKYLSSMEEELFQPESVKLSDIWKKQKLRNIEFLQYIGKEINYPIFAEAEWLINNYVHCYDMLIMLAKIKSKKPTYHHETIERYNETIKSYEADIKHKIDVTDFVNETERRVVGLTKILSESLKYENDYLRKEFAYELFQNLFGLPKGTFSKNEPLAIFVKEIHEEWKKKLIPLEHIARAFEIEGERFG